MPWSSYAGRERGRDRSEGASLNPPRALPQAPRELEDDGAQVSSRQLFRYAHRHRDTSGTGLCEFMNWV